MHIQNSKLPILMIELNRTDRLVLAKSKRLASKTLLRYFLQCSCNRTSRKCKLTERRLYSHVENCYSGGIAPR
jgi:hypothetical protein